MSHIFIWDHPLINRLEEVVHQYNIFQKFIPISPYDPSRQHLSLDDESLHICIEVLNTCSNLLDGFNHFPNVDIYHENHEPCYRIRVTLLRHLLEFILHMQHVRYDLINCSSQLLRAGFIQVQTKIYNYLKNLTQWLGQILIIYDSNQDKLCSIGCLIEEIIYICVSVIDTNNSDKEIFTSTVLVLSTIIPIVRHHMSYDRMNSIRLLINHVGKLHEISDPFSKCQSYKLLIKLVSPLTLAQLETAKEFFRSIFLVLHDSLNNPTMFFYDNNQQTVIARRLFINYITQLSELVELVRMENMTMRKNFNISIEYLIVDLLRFLSFIINRDTEYEIAIISFLHTIIDILRPEMSPEINISILQTIFCLFNIENVQNILREQKSNTHAVLTKFLEFVSLVINYADEFISMRAKLRSMIVDLCIKTLYPAIRKDFSIDIRKTYYKLVRNLLICEWSYFCKENVSNTFNHEINKTSVEYSFIKLMESIAWSFTQSDMEQFRINLTTWNEFQLKSRLYTRVIFRKYMCQPFLSLLLTLSLIRSHELYRDDIISILFRILTPDNNTIDFTHFIRNYLEESNIKTVLNEKQRCLLLQKYGHNKMDLPSFTQNLNSFIHDYRLYARRNPDCTNLYKSFVFFIYDSFCL